MEEQDDPPTTKKYSRFNASRFEMFLSDMESKHRLSVAHHREVLQVMESYYDQVEREYAEFDDIPEVHQERDDVRRDIPGRIGPTDDQWQSSLDYAAKLACDRLLELRPDLAPEVRKAFGPRFDDAGRGR